MAAPIMYTAVGLLLCVTTVLQVFSHQIDDEFEGSRTLSLEHSFTLDKPVFSKRGTIVIRSLKSNKAHFTSSNDFSREDVDLLKKTSAGKGIYQVRVPVKTGSQNYVSTFIPACALYESSLNDHLTLSFDQSGELLGLSINTSPSLCEGVHVPVSNFSDWKTTVEVTQTVSGPVPDNETHVVLTSSLYFYCSPDTQTYIEKMNKDKMEKEKGGQGDNRSFFGKYWMYIVPVVILMMIATSADPNAQGGGGGGR